MALVSNTAAMTRRERRQRLSRRNSLYLLAITMGLIFVLFLVLPHPSKTVTEPNGSADAYMPAQPLPRVTVLILGLDTVDQDEPQSSVRSDTIIIGTIDITDRTVRLLFVPRDSYVQIPSRGWDKINHAFAYGGGTRGETGLWLAQAALKEFVSIENIDYYALVDMQAVARLVDRIGGVPVEVGIDDPRLPPRGLHMLTGSQFLTYARSRNDGQGDIGRIKRQQHLLQALLKHVQTIAAEHLVSLVRFALEELQTNITLTQALAFSPNLANIASLECYIVPGKADYINGVSYWVPDVIALEPILREVFGPE